MASSSAASELPADFAKTMARWVISASVEGSQLAVRPPEAPADLYASAVALAGMLGRSGGLASAMGLGSGQTSRPVGLGDAHTGCMWSQKPSHAKETFLLLSDSTAAGPPRALCVPIPPDIAINAVLLFATRVATHKDSRRRGLQSP